ncbi:MAG TPA: hypothetical protein VMH91_02990 [Candidatus Paceibacterota bacterium]|nr:hypothetical protein [Candidatus Paceibacterota bacterium]
MKKGARLAAFAALALPSIALAAGVPQNFKDLANQIVGILNNATFDLIVLAIVIYFYGVSTSLFKGEKGRENLRQQLIWGLLVIFFAVSIWGVVQLLQNTFLNGGGGAGGSGVNGQNCTSLTCQFGTSG